MAVATFSFFSLSSLLGGSFSFNWENNFFKAALLDNSIDLSTRTQTLWNQVSSAEIAAAGGYPAGGVPLVSKTIVNNSGVADYGAAPAVFSDITNTVKYVAIYEITAGHLVAFVDLDTGNAAGITLVAETLEVSWNSNYIFRIAI